MSAEQRIGLVARGDGAIAIGVALVAGMVGTRRAQAGVLAVVPGGCGVPRTRGWIPARPVARRLAASLTLRGIPAWPCGRLVIAWLDDDPDVALTQARRIDAAAAQVPVVTLVSAARSPATDTLLAAQASTVIAVPADAPDSLAALARNGPTTRLVALDVPAVARGLAPTGVPVLPSIRRLGRELGDDTGTERGAAQAGQALLVVLGALLMLVVLALAVGAVAAGLGQRNDQQRAADLAALAAARRMAADYADIVAPVGDGHAHEPRAGAGAPGTLDPGAYLARARATARATARRNGADGVVVSFPGARAGELPLRVAVTVPDELELPGGPVPAGARAEAELVPPVAAALPGDGAGGAGEYRGPLEHRDGKPMRPDVARAYDRMAAAARADGVALLVVSGFRSDAEQAVLFSRHPDPKWVAPPGRSLHRLGTELDLGPAAAYRWLARHARRFGFLQRYAWEPWHYGFVRNAGTASVGYGGRRAGRGEGGAGSVLPAWVPARYRADLARAAQRWNVGAVLLAAQLQVESGFDPAARSSAGAQGIAQFMPATAKLMGLSDPWDAATAIDAQAHLMRNLLRTFGAVPLALAAYNAGEGAVARCRCAGPSAETRAYVARILALVLGTGDVAGLGADQLTVRLVR